MILPGLCDVHNHGYNNGSANNATPEWLKKWIAYLPQ
jgi:N-acetylglucosamine-6-phosphate deacetylase